MTAGIHDLVALMVGFAGSVITSPYGDRYMPEKLLLDPFPSGFRTEVHRPSGEVVGVISSRDARRVEFQDIPDSLVNAVIAIEDARFLDHNGIDPLGILGAIASSAKGVPRGGSGLSQQLAKNSFTGNAPTLERKIIEANLALSLHARLGPQEVLRRYLQTAWFGRGAYGIVDAADVWFNKHPLDLSLAEAALLAAMLKGPGHYDPEKHPDRAAQRRNTVIARLSQLGWISEDDRDAALATPIEVVARPARGHQGMSVGEYRRLQAELEQMAEPPAVVVSTFDKNWQTLAQRVLQSSMERTSPQTPLARMAEEELAEIKGADALPNDVTGTIPYYSPYVPALFEEKTDAGWTILTHAGRREGVSITTSGYTPSVGDILAIEWMSEVTATAHARTTVEGAVSVYDTMSGAILASVGSVDPNLSEFDRTHALRQPGSSAKPFLWLDALRNGMQPDAFLPDIEQDYVLADGGTWRPRNYDRSESGLLPLYVGLEWSSNLMAAHLVDELGVYGMADLAEGSGAYGSGDFNLQPSSALGASETTLARMTAGYAALVRGGIAIEAHSIDAPTGSYRFSDPDSVGQLLPMLRGVVTRGTASKAFKDHPVPVIGKSGTSQDARDTWFFAATPSVTIGVWLGRDDNKPLPAHFTGGQSSAPIAARILSLALEQKLLPENGWENWPPAPYQNVAFEMMMQDGQMPVRAAVAPSPSHAGRNEDPNQDLLDMLSLIR